MCAIDQIKYRSIIINLFCCCFSLFQNLVFEHLCRFEGKNVGVLRGLSSNSIKPKPTVSFKKLDWFKQKGNTCWSNSHMFTYSTSYLKKMMLHPMRLLVTWSIMEGVLLSLFTPTHTPSIQTFVFSDESIHLRNAKHHHCLWECGHSQWPLRLWNIKKNNETFDRRGNTDDLVHSVNV